MDYLSSLILYGEVHFFGQIIFYRFFVLIGKFAMTFQSYLSFVAVGHLFLQELAKWKRSFCIAILRQYCSLHLKQYDFESPSAISAQTGEVKESLLIGIVGHFFFYKLKTF